jgi:hypothetical protein
MYYNDDVDRPGGDPKLSIWERNVELMGISGNSRIELVIAHPGSSSQVSGEEKPARIEVHSRQIQASHLRKPIAQLTTEGVTDM